MPGKVHRNPCDLAALTRCKPKSWSSATMNLTKKSTSSPVNLSSRTLNPPSLLPGSAHFPNHKRANRLLTMMGSAAIVIDSDSEDGIDCDSEDGIETDDDDDDDDDGENQDILGLLSQMADHSGLRAPTRTQSTSVLETCRARTERGSSRTFAGSILSQAGPPVAACIDGRALIFGFC